MPIQDWLHAKLFEHMQGKYGEDEKKWDSGASCYWCCCFMCAHETCAATGMPVSTTCGNLCGIVECCPLDIDLEHRRTYVKQEVNCMPGGFKERQKKLKQLQKQLLELEKKYETKEAKASKARVEALEKAEKTYKSAKKKVKNAEKAANTLEDIGIDVPDLPDIDVDDICDLDLCCDVCEIPANPWLCVKTYKAHSRLKTVLQPRFRTNDVRAESARPPAPQTQTMQDPVEEFKAEPEAKAQPEAKVQQPQIQPVVEVELPVFEKHCETCQCHKHCRTCQCEPVSSSPIAETKVQLQPAQQPAQPRPAQPQQTAAQPVTDAWGGGTAGGYAPAPFAPPPQRMRLPTPTANKWGSKPVLNECPNCKKQNNSKPIKKTCTPLNFGLCLCCGPFVFCCSPCTADYEHHCEHCDAVVGKDTRL
jgi:hypothetical protein